MGPKARIVKMYSGVSDRSEIVHLIAKLFAPDGGPGSGNHNHAGRPGKVGGSAPNGSGNAETAEKNKVLSGFSVRIGNSIEKKAHEHPKVYDDWASSLTADESRAIEEQYKETHGPDTDENVSEYYERIWRILASEAKETEKENKAVSAEDITDGYEAPACSYTEPDFGQVVDTEIEDIIVKQHFNGVPKIVSREEFDKFIKDHPESPIMMRTFSAPDEATLSQYDKGLEKGEWYVDCTIGGSKYGQGMYTAAAYPWNVDDLTSIYREGNTAERGSVFSGVHDGEKEVYQLADVNPGFMFGGGEEGETFVFINDDPHDCVVVTKENGKLVDRQTGNTYEDDSELLKAYDTVSKINILPMEELSKRDISRPLGQMREYIRMNERRTTNNSPEGKRYYKELQEHEDNSVPSHGSFKVNEPPPKYVSINAEAGSSEEKFYKVDEEGSDLTQEKLDGLEAGVYLVTYPGRALYDGQNKMCLVRVNEDGTKESEGPGYDFENRMRFAISRGGKIYKCKDDTPQRPTSHTSTRIMTLDPTSKMITYEKLEDMYEEYKNTHPDKVCRREGIEAVSEKESFTQEQREAFEWIVDYEDGRLPPSAMLEIRGVMDKLGGREKVKSLLDLYYDKYSSKRVRSIQDVGAYAAALGYDAVVCSNYGRTIVVLNRTRLILSDERVEVPNEEAV